MKTLNAEIVELREQQIQIVRMLKNKALLTFPGGLNKETWVSLLKGSGFTEEDMARWHAQFESHSPENHQQFLEFLYIPDEDIRTTREEARIFRKNMDVESL